MKSSLLINYIKNHNDVYNIHDIIPSNSSNLNYNLGDFVQIKSNNRKKKNSKNSKISKNSNDSLNNDEKDENDETNEYYFLVSKAKVAYKIDMTTNEINKKSYKESFIAIPLVVLNENKYPIKNCKNIIETVLQSNYVLIKLSDIENTVTALYLPIDARPSHLTFDYIYSFDEIPHRSKINNILVYTYQKVEITNSTPCEETKRFLKSDKQVIYFSAGSPSFYLNYSNLTQHH